MREEGLDALIEDDLTKHTQEKNREIFDMIQCIGNDLIAKEENVQIVIETLHANIELFRTLSIKFPDIFAFKTSLEQNEFALISANKTFESLQESVESISNISNQREHQDANDEKMQHAIALIHSFSQYMNSLFKDKEDEEKRTASSEDIVENTSSRAFNDDIENFLAQFGK